MKAIDDDLSELTDALYNVLYRKHVTYGPGQRALLTTNVIWDALEDDTREEPR